MQNPESILENETQSSLGFCDTNRSPNFSWMTRPSDNQQRKESAK